MWGVRASAKWILDCKLDQDILILFNAMADDGSSYITIWTLIMSEFTCQITSLMRTVDEERDRVLCKPLNTLASTFIYNKLQINTFISFIIIKS